MCFNDASSRSGAFLTKVVLFDKNHGFSFNDGIFVEMVAVLLENGGVCLQIWWRFVLK